MARKLVTCSLVLVACGLVAVGLSPVLSSEAPALKISAPDPALESKPMTIQDGTQLQYAGSRVVFVGRPASLRARLTEDDGYTPIANRAVRFRLGSQTCVAETNSSGYALCAIVVSGPAGSKTLQASFSGDYWYKPTALYTGIVVK